MQTTITLATSDLFKTLADIRNIAPSAHLAAPASVLHAGATGDVFKVSLAMTSDDAPAFRRWRRSAV